MLKRFREMSRRTLLMLSAGALCALGIGAALALANSGDADTLNNTVAKQVITAKSPKAVFKDGILTTECESEGGIETAEVNQKLPYTAALNKPALAFTKCTNGVTVKVNGATKLTLESGNANRTTDPDPAYDGADENDADTGTLTLPTGSSIEIKLPFPLSCTIVISGGTSGQTFTGSTAAEDEGTDADVASLVFNAVPVTTNGGCGLSTAATFSGTYAVTPATLDDLS